MARIRTIKPEFFSHEILASKSAHARLLAIGLLTLADCKGRIRWVPMQVHSQVFPWEATVKIEVLLGELIDASYVLHYEVSGKRYVEVVNFNKHQRLSGKESAYESKLPPPPEKPNDSLDEIGERNGKQSGASQGSVGNPLGTGEHRNIGTGEHITKMPASRCKEKYPDHFEQFWEAYPPRRRTGKQATFKAWKKSVKEGVDEQLLIRAAKAYAMSTKGSGEFSVSSSRFLNDGMWDDDPESAWGGIDKAQLPDTYELFKKHDWAFVTDEDGYLKLHDGLEYDKDYTEPHAKPGWKVERNGRCAKITRI